MGVKIQKHICHAAPLVQVQSASADGLLAVRFIPYTNHLLQSQCQECNCIIAEYFRSIETPLKKLLKARSQKKNEIKRKFCQDWAVCFTLVGDKVYCTVERAYLILVTGTTGGACVNFS